MDSYRSFRPEHIEVVAVRRFVAEVMIRCGGCGHDRDLALLLSSELATNAVVHAKSDVDVVVRCEGPVMTVEVHDDSDVMPAELDVAPEELSGRGIQIVAALADFWGARSIPGHGKVVWFSLLPQGPLL